MMYFHALVLLFTVGAAVGQTPNCLVLQQLECGDDPVTVIPSTAEELRTACKAKQDYSKCNAEFYGTCHATVRKVPLENRYLEILRNGCDENNEDYEVVSRNIGCISSNFNEAKEMCMELKEFQQEVESFQRSLFPSIPNGMGEEAAYCSMVLSVHTCASIAISKRCGEELQKPVAEMSKVFSPYYSYLCSDDMVGRIQPHLTAFEESLKAKINTRNTDEERTSNILSFF